MKSFDEHFKGAKNHNQEDLKWLLACYYGTMMNLCNEYSYLGDEDLFGLINMFPDSNMPSDAYAEIVYRTTYSIVALGIYLKLKLKKETPEWLEQSLPIIMNAAFEKGIVAHGTNGWLDAIDIMKMLILAGARKFIEQNAQSATNFTRQMKMVMSYYAKTIAESDQNPDKWAIGTKAMQSVLAAWDGYTHTIFVYGTLMRGERSHKILAKEMYGGTAILDGYEIYDCFQYPGVMEKENRKVFGEVYFVREQTLEMIDFYENEGVLFRRKKVMLSGKLKGDVYVYYDCDNPCDLVLNRLWSTDLKKRVWYAGYGSNLSSKRFECYIRGGLCAENIHNHIMLNAVSFYDYKKLRTVPYRTARQIRDISDRLCMEAHLSVIDDPQKIGQLYPENAGKKKSVSTRTEIRKRLDFCLERATDYSQFLSMAKGLEITPTIRGKHITYYRVPFISIRNFSGLQECFKMKQVRRICCAGRWCQQH